MGKYDLYKPDSLNEFFDAVTEGSLSKEDHELIELVLLESRETMKSFIEEVGDMDERLFSLDSFYEIQELIEEYKRLINDLKIKDDVFKKYLGDLFEILENKNPVNKVASKNGGYVLIHTASLDNAELILSKEIEKEALEICASGSNLKEKGGLFRTAKREIDCGLIFDPQDAKAFFSRDMASKYDEDGRRILEDRMKKHKFDSLDGALSRGAKRTEAWIDAKSSPIYALLIIDETKKEDILQLSKKYNLPVLYNTHLYE